MTPQQIRDLAEQLRATDVELDALLTQRATVKGFDQDHVIVAKLNAASPRKKTVARMITKRAIIDVLVLRAPPLLKALRQFAQGNAPDGAPLTEGHPLKPYSDLAAETIPYLDGIEGIDIGSATTQGVLGALAQARFIDAADASKVAALGLVDNPLTLAEVSQALSEV